MLTALVWKDLRINRLPLIVGAVLMIAPYVLLTAIVMNLPLWEEATRATAWAVLLASACQFSVMCSQASLAMLSGHLIAVERGDRSAEFLAYLPPSRALVLLSKAIVLAAALLVVYGVNLTLLEIASRLSADADATRVLTSNLTSLPRLAAVGFLAMGAGWCASAMLDGTGTAVALAFVAPMALFGLLQATRAACNWPDDLSFAAAYFGACRGVGLALAVLGTCSYLRRVEP
jgi:ABC-type transport system involved in multi-copper enzyme maturation permease subunit